MSTRMNVTSAAPGVEPQQPLWQIARGAGTAPVRLITEAEMAGPAGLRGASLEDVPAIAALLDGWARKGLVLPRTIGQLYRNVREFTVATRGDVVVGSVALRLYSPALAEIGALAVDGAHHGGGVGRRLVESQIDLARRLGLERVFALTLQDGFFHRLGFRTVPIAEFPDKIAADCAACAKRAACAEIAVALEL